MGTTNVLIVGGADSDSTLTLTGTSVSIGNGTISGTNTGDQSLFSTVAVSGQSNVVADTTTDTLTLAAGSGITITTDAGTDTVTIASSAASSYVYLTQGTASNSTALEFTGLSATYACYVFEFLNIVPATDSVLLHMRTSSNNGSSYDSAAGNYAWVGHSTEGTEDPAQNGNGSTSATSIVLSPLAADTWGSAAEERGCGTVKLFDHSNTAAYARVYATFSVFGASGAQMVSVSGGCRLAAAAVDAVQFYFSSGNIESGTIKVYGIKAS